MLVEAPVNAWIVTVKRIKRRMPIDRERQGQKPSNADKRID